MIFRRFAHIVLASLGILGAAACAGTEDTPDVPEVDERMVNITFSVVVQSATNPVESRGNIVTTPDADNYFEKEASKFERIHSLRIIILRPDGEVEHNQLFNYDAEGRIISDVMKFRVVSGETKKIYLLANGEDLYDFDRIKVSTQEAPSYYNGTSIENIIIYAGSNGTLITASDGKYVPMSEAFDVDVPAPDEGWINALQGLQTKDLGVLFITRAAVKFTFAITADNAEGLYLSDIVFNNIADKEYYLPFNTTYSPAKSEAPVVNWSGAADPNISGRFITSYSVPGTTTHTPLRFNFEDGPRDLSAATTDKPFVWTAPYYFCESKFIDTEDISNPYQVALTVTAKDDKGSFIDADRFVPVRLPNLPTLPRNTHVLVKIHINARTLTAQVTLVPYIGVWLDPTFGFENLYPWTRPTNPDVQPA